jgi:hypothetical protein
VFNAVVFARLAEGVHSQITGSCSTAFMETLRCMSEVVSLSH